MIVAVPAAPKTVHPGHSPKGIQGMTPPQEALAFVLATLRRRARMSQRELSAYSKRFAPDGKGVSYTQIGDLERAVGYNASPLTLRAIARGLAADEYAPGGFDQVRADAFYRQLMDAAGYLSGLPIEAPVQTGAGDVLEFLASKTGDSTISERLLRLAEKYPELAAEDQMVMRRLVDSWLKEE